MSRPATAGTEAGVAAFDFAGPLPDGTTVLEASAGTGKTHAIGALVTDWHGQRWIDLPQGVRASRRSGVLVLEGGVKR